VIKLRGVTESAVSIQGQQTSRCDCSSEYQPVCASLHGYFMDYSNECSAICEYVSLCVSNKNKKAQL